MADIVTEMQLRIAEIERKQDTMFRHGPVHERKKIDGEWLVRIKTGGTEDKPTLSPWLPYTQQNGGPNGLNVYRVPQKGENMTMISPSGDPRQALLTPMFWSNEHKPPSQDEDEIVVTHPKFKLTLKDGNLEIASSETITFKSAQKISFQAAGSEVEIKQGHVNIVSPQVHTVGETHLSVAGKDAQGIKMAVVEGLEDAQKVKVGQPFIPDPKVAELEAAAAGGGGGV